MNGQSKIALLGALGGAALALLLVFGASAFGLLPQRLDGKQVHAYLLDHPEIFIEMQVKLQARDAETAAREQRDAMQTIGLKTFFDPRVAFVTGPVNAKQTFVEFYDYDCPFCRASLPAVKNYYEAHRNDTRFSFIEFPIPQQHGPGAVLAAKASLAARKQPDKFVAFHFALMGEEGAVTEQMIFDDAAKCGLDVAKLKADMAGHEIDVALDIAHKLALRAKIDGTPTFVINGHLHAGAVSDDDLKDLVKQTPV
ncbi:MAG: DsbA family protein [Rhizomicrobium sp.]